MASGTQTSSEYIKHHLTPLRLGEEGSFWSIHLDTLFFSIVLGFIFIWLFRKAAWMAGTLAYFSFIFVTLIKVISGAESCGCFGAVHVDPMITLFAIDIPFFLLLAIFWPRNCQLLPPPWPNKFYLLTVAVPTIGLMIMSTPMLITFRPDCITVEKNPSSGAGETDQASGINGCRVGCQAKPSSGIPESGVWQFSPKLRNAVCLAAAARAWGSCRCRICVNTGSVSTRSRWGIFSTHDRIGLTADKLITTSAASQIIVARSPSGPNHLS